MKSTLSSPGLSVQVSSVAGPLEKSLQYVELLISLWNQCEELFFKLCPTREEPPRSQPPRRRNLGNCPNCRIKGADSGGRQQADCHGKLREIPRHADAGYFHGGLLAVVGFAVLLAIPLKRGWDVIPIDDKKTKSDK